MTIDEMWNIAQKFYELGHGVKFHRRPTDEEITYLYKKMQEFKITMERYYNEGPAALKRLV